MICIHGDAVLYEVDFDRVVVQTRPTCMYVKYVEIYRQTMLITQCLLTTSERVCVYGRSHLSCLCSVRAVTVKSLDLETLFIYSVQKPSVCRSVTLNGVTNRNR